jgi:hypothetical protein
LGELFQIHGSETKPLTRPCGAGRDVAIGPELTAPNQPAQS